MLKPNMSAMPGMNAMTDTFEFMKNLWGGMNTSGMGIPGMVMPTLSVEDINKQIKDLKAVESWLNVNMNMLRGTIQALEVQSATISALQSMGETFSAAAKSNAETGASAASAFQFPFSKADAAPDMAEESVQPSAPAPKSEPKRKSRSELKAEFKGESKSESGASAKPSPKPNPEPAGAVPPLANPAIWWNMLQDQFQQALSTAISDEPAAPSAQPTPAAPRKRKSPPKKI